MNPRTFARRFRATLGVTPYQWLLQLLDTTTEPIEQIATHYGFDSATALRRHVRRRLPITP